MFLRDDRVRGDDLQRGDQDVLIGRWYTLSPRQLSVHHKLAAVLESQRHCLTGGADKNQVA